MLLSTRYPKIFSLVFCLGDGKLLQVSNRMLYMVYYSLITCCARVVISRDIQKSTVPKARTMMEAISILTLRLPSLSLTPLISATLLPKHDLSFFNLLFTSPFHCHRFNSLYGAGLAAEFARDREKAKAYYNKLLEVASQADTRRPRLEHARRYLNSGLGKGNE